ncbi:MAG: ATP-binding protein [Prevotella sp.]|nr:ATP-binding protein [Prevotella sp.]
MKTITNPFIVSGYIPERYFCDRDKETQWILRRIVSHEHVLLMSQRRMGKTKLIEHCFESDEIQKNYITLAIDILHTTTFREFVQQLGNVVYDSIAKRSAKMMKVFTSAMRSLSASFGYDPVQNTPTFDIKLGDISAPDYTLKEIFEVMEKADKRCIIVIDEFQQVAKYTEKNAEALLRSHIQHLNNVIFVFCGSQRHLMESMFFSEKRPFYMSARSIVLEPISRDDYRDFAMRQFMAFGKSIAPEAVDAVYDSLGGVTLYLQRIMKDAFNETPKGEQCVVEMVKELMSDYIQECDTRFREQLAFISETQKELLYAIYEENAPVTGITSAKFMKRYRLKSASSVQSAAKKLLEYDILTRSEGCYSVADPLLALWLRTRR